MIVLAAACGEATESAVEGLPNPGWIATFSPLVDSMVLLRNSLSCVKDALASGHSASSGIRPFTGSDGFFPILDDFISQSVRLQ